jgi:two-component system, LuxR family, sensor kinase FixL
MSMNLKLRGKFNLLILSLLIVSVGVLSLYLFQKEKTALIQNSLANIKSIIRIEGLKIEDLILEAANDVKILSKSPSLRQIIRVGETIKNNDPLDGSTEDISRSRLAAVFKAFISEKRYFQIRFIGMRDQGREIVRVDKYNGQLMVTPRSKLQSKGHAPYFEATTKLSPEHVYVSPINLNRELGKIAEPHVATIRIATPVYDLKGNVYGLVVINLNLNSTLNSLVNRDKGLYVINEDGDFIAHQDSQLDFGFDLGKRYRVFDSYPGIVPFMSENDARREYSFVGRNPDPELVYIWKQNIGAKDNGHFIGMMKKKKVSEITGGLVSVYSETLVLVLGLLTFSLIAGIFFTRRLTRPLEQLTSAATQFAVGRLNSAITIETADEIGELGRAFNAMVEERNKRELELKKFSNAVQQSPTTIIITDIEGNIEYANPSFYELNGFAFSDEVIGKNMSILSSGEHSFDYIEEFWQTILDGRIWRGEWCNKKKNGDLYWARAVTSSIKDKVGIITHFVEVKEDITEQKKKDEELRESKLRLEKSNQNLLEFASYASHDLGEPLRKISVFGNYLREGASNLEEKQKDYLRRMIRAADRMQLLVEQLLEYSKVSDTKVRFQSFDLEEVVAIVKDDLEIRLAETGGSIECVELPTVFADKMLVTQLIQNLIGNSLKYCKEGVRPEIKINSFLEGGYYKIVLTDNGIGMDEKNLERIFKPFNRLHGRSEYEGAGIGLAICYKVVEVHGGIISAKSRLGEGSTFIFTLSVNPALH